MLKIRNFFQIATVLLVLLLPTTLALAQALQQGGSTGNPSTTSGGSTGFSSSPGGSTGYPAGTPGGSTGFTLQNPLGSNGPQTLCGLIKKIVDVVVAVGFPFAVFFIVYAGFLFVWARGNPVELAHARRNLMYTVIGLMIFFGAWLLTQVIANTLNSIGNPTIQICQ